MSVAAITFVYNESVNLPIWLRYYGKMFGPQNLYVVDRESNDGSTDSLGGANRIVIPRDAFDDYKKTDFITLLHTALLKYHRTVIYTDCDELLVPDLRKFADLGDYVEKANFEWVTCVGLNLVHMIHLEEPLDLSRPILAQRRFAFLLASTCKTLISRVPIAWQPGFHSLNRQPRIDPDLFMLHTKTMDYGIAIQRQKINTETVWSEDSLTAGHGGHHRYDQSVFVRQCFFDPINTMNQGKLSPFEFSAEINEFHERTQEIDGVFHVPMSGIMKLVEVPDYMRSAF